MDPNQVEQFRSHLRTLNARETCPICDRDDWSYTVAWAVSAIRRACQCCGQVQFFDPRPLGLQTAYVRSGGAARIALRPITEASEPPGFKDFPPLTIEELRGEMGIEAALREIARAINGRAVS
jgi:hypothetical protein